MKIINILIVTLIFLSLLILIDMGHEALPLGYMEVGLIPYLFSPGAFASGLKDILFFSFILSALAGHIMLLVSLKSKVSKIKMTLALIGQILLLSSIVYLVRFVNGDHFEYLTFYWSLPTLMNMVILTICLFRGKNMRRETIK